MHTDQQPHSAVILSFPTATRRAALNLSNKAKFAAELAALPRMNVDTDAWYHQAAIDDADTPHN
jgi:hypothetical protein